MLKKRKEKVLVWTAEHSLLHTRDGKNVHGPHTKDLSNGHKNWQYYTMTLLWKENNIAQTKVNHTQVTGVAMTTVHNSSFELYDHPSYFRPGTVGFLSVPEADEAHFTRYVDAEACLNMQDDASFQAGTVALQ